jgi:UrcA family protein
MLKPIIAVLAAVASFAATVSASAEEQPQPAPQSIPQSIIVSHADLNLAKAHDAREFMRRIDRAVAKVCDMPVAGSADEERYQQCRTATLAQLRPQAAQMIAHADRPLEVAAR